MSHGRIVDEGLLIALSAVRMAVKNDIIVGALKDHADYAAARYAGNAIYRLSELAQQNVDDGLRVGRQRKVLARARWSNDLSEDQHGDIRQFALRRRVHTRLAAALTAVAADSVQVAQIVEMARQAASGEIQDAVSARLVRLAIDDRDPDYALRRAARTEMFVLIDLALLSNAHETAQNGGDDGY